MDPTRFRQRLKNEEILIGLSLNYPSPAIIETIGRMWDFLWLDGQHGQLSYDNMLAMVRSADMVGADTLVRVPGRESGIVGPYADMAPTALMIPMINTPEDAAAAVDAAKFPPLGSRSYGGRRAIDLADRTYYLDKEPVLVAQIETPEAVKNVHAIAQTEGIDVLMLGPDDFKIQVGLAINAPILETPVLLDAFKTVAVAAREAGKSAICIATTSELARHALSLGYRMIIGGSDKQFLYDASNGQQAMLRETLGCKN